jgi:hypothetical protein
MPPAQSDEIFIPTAPSPPRESVVGNQAPAQEPPKEK